MGRILVSYTILETIDDVDFDPSDYIKMREFCGEYFEEKYGIDADRIDDIEPEYVED